MFAEVEQLVARLCVRVRRGAAEQAVAALLGLGVKLEWGNWV